MDNLLEYLDVPIKFWSCPDPDHRNATVTWKGDRATCNAQGCGQTNHAMDIPGVLRVLVWAESCIAFEDWTDERSPDKSYTGCADFGKTRYWYAPKVRQLRGHDRSGTRVLALGECDDPLWLDLANERYLPWPSVHAHYTENHDSRRTQL